MGRPIATTTALCCALLGLLAPAATAKDASLAGAAAFAGITVEGSPYRYLALSPRRAPRLTVVERVELAGGRVDRWWHLRGGYQVPKVAYDRGGGLAADEGTLILSAISNGDYSRPRRVSRFAILRTDTRRPIGSGPDRGTAVRAVTYVSLPGELTLTALSPDGSVAYFSRQLGGRFSDDLGLVALDTDSARLLPPPSAAAGEAAMEGAPVTQTESRDGRWVYTLYFGDARRPFVQLLDTVANRVSRVELPRLLGRLRNPFLLRLRRDPNEARLVVADRASAQGSANLTPLLSVDLSAGSVRREWGMASVTLMPRAVPLRDQPRGRLGFLFTPVHPGTLLGRSGVAGRSAGGRPIRVVQWGDPAIARSVLVFGCIHGDECAARKLQPRFVDSGGCPDPDADLVVVRNLDPDGLAEGTRLNGDGVDLNRNFPVDWRPIGVAGDPQYSGPRPFSEPEARLAARIVERVDPAVTIWFHQHRGPRPLVRAWGQSAPAGRRFARLAGIPFHLLPWLDGTAPNWQNHRFPGTSSFVVELPAGPLAAGLEQRLGVAVARLAHRVGED